MAGCIVSDVSVGLCHVSLYTISCVYEQVIELCE